MTQLNTLLSLCGLDIKGIKYSNFRHLYSKNGKLFEVFVPVFCSHFESCQLIVFFVFQLSVRVTPGMPRVDMSDTLKERIKLAMVKRYNTVTKALDLTRFHLDPGMYLIPSF